MLQGGLGNQLFQYAMGLAQAQRLGVELQLDASRLGGKPHRILNLDLFEGPAKHKVVYGSTPTVVEQGFQYGDYDVVDDDVLCGYWQCEEYFRTYVPQMFRALRPAQPFPQLFFPYAERLITEAGDASCFLGIRRGDYIAKQDYHGVLPLDYYERALRYVHNMTGKRPKVFVFSDDMDWCKNELKLPYQFEVVGSYFPTVGNVKGREDADIYLMGLCHNAIIANSSFHWWGAWAGDFRQQSRVVVAPQQWFTTTAVDSSTVTPERWARL